MNLVHRYTSKQEKNDNGMNSHNQETHIVNTFHAFHTKILHRVLEILMLI
jgi:hypothetical protein